MNILNVTNLSFEFERYISCCCQQINPESAAKTLAPPTVIDSESEEDEEFEEVVEVPYEYTEEELVWKEVTKEEVVERSLPQVKGMYPYSGQGLEMEKGEVGGVVDRGGERWL